MINYACDSCDFRIDIEYLPRVYFLPDHRSLAMLQRHIWCLTCQHVAVAEALRENPDDYAMRQEYYEHLRKSLESGNQTSASTKEMTQEFIEESEEKTRLIAEWQRLRTAGPRCLRCGNTDIIVPDSCLADLGHRPCLGILRCRFTIWAGTHMDRRLPHQYDVDGNLIRRGKVSEEIDADDLDLWWPGT